MRPTGFAVGLCSVLLMGVSSLSMAQGVFFGVTNGPCPPSFFENELVLIQPSVPPNASFVGPTGFCGFNSLASDSRLDLYAFISLPFDNPHLNELIRIDEITGQGTSVVKVKIPLDVRGLAFSPSDVLFAVVNGSPDELWTIHVNDGTASRIGEIGLVNLGSLEFSQEGVLYSWDGFGGSGAGLVTLDPGTGTATDVNPDIDSQGILIQSLLSLPTGTFFGASQTDLYLIDIETGAATLVGPFDIGPAGPWGIRGIARAGVVVSIALGARIDRTVDDTLTLSFEIQTEEEVTWNLWVEVGNEMHKLWSAPIPAVPSLLSFDLPIPDFPMLGKIGFLSTFVNNEGIAASDWVVVDTGGDANALSSFDPRDIMRGR